jgi:hypothetical protein
MSEPRDLLQRKVDALEKLSSENDVWVATTSGTGEPCLVPLSFAWVDERIVLVTARRNRTARNIAATGAAHLVLGPTRDVVSLEGTAVILESGVIAEEDADRYCAQAGWDPRPVDSMVWIVFWPRRVQVWREVDELEERTVMEDGRWLV